MAAAKKKSLLPSYDISPSAAVIKAIGEIDQFKGEWKAAQDLALHLLQTLEHATLVKSTGSSTRIEGTQLNDREVEELLAETGSKRFTTDDEQEVAGYASAVTEVLKNHSSISVSEKYIWYLHSTMLQYSSKDYKHRGQYKKRSNLVTAFDQTGKNRVVWLRPASPTDTPLMMRELVAWFNMEASAGRQHVLLLIAVFIVVFLAIHPFQDGNGRISRILTTFLLLKASYAYVPYSSMESIIEENKTDYYRALHFTQQTLPTSQQNWHPWIDFFISTVERQKNNLSSKLVNERRLRESLPPVARKILEFVRNRGDASIKEIVEKLTIDRNIARTHLRNLTVQDYLIIVGKGRSSRYVKK